ncbi:unnamed protein product [Dicrocoelium dendriticum]|nr:unnamed protein product [Dicrocoelium dendriticum]
MTFLSIFSRPLENIQPNLAKENFVIIYVHTEREERTTEEVMIFHDEQLVDLIKHQKKKTRVNNVQMFITYKRTIPFDVHYLRRIWSKTNWTSSGAFNFEFISSHKRLISRKGSRFVIQPQRINKP